MGISLWLTDLLDLFRLCPLPSLVGAYYLPPPPTLVPYFYNDVVCNGTCSVTDGGGGGGGGEGTNAKKNPIYSETCYHSVSSERKTLTPMNVEATQYWERDKFYIIDCPQ